ncbi:MAG: rRNA maturation RNase YbeY [Nitrospirae bacterium]|nr:rRNA maturation RNase YbeY [Nitrospirota bacterium]
MDRIEETAGKILDLLKRPDAELSILFVGNRRMKELNTSFRGIKKATDVLSFEASLPIKGCPGGLLGDIVINIHRAITQAEAAGSGIYDEISRLLLHGILHLLGYDHVNGGAEERRMKAKEKKLTAALQNAG